jgi:hypothetical protein
MSDVPKKPVQLAMLRWRGRGREAVGVADDPVGHEAAVAAARDAQARGVDLKDTAAGLVRKLPSGRR